MNFLAKHFFDYQSFINLPHTAVQMHKTPPSQAGTDPSAAWAPKDLHVAGKNQAAPAARANRNYHGDQRTGSHRHGRPSKLEFRNWGERHGELREEKIVPHQMVEGDHHARGSLDSSSSALAAFHGGHGAAAIDHFPSEYFPARALKLHQQQQQQMLQLKQRSLDGLPPSAHAPPGTPPLRVLLILTVTPHLDFVSATVKAVRGLGPEAKDPIVKLRLYDGTRLLEERGGPQHRQRSSSEQPTIQIHPPPDQAGVDERQLGQSFLLKAPNPMRLPFCHLSLSLYAPGGDGSTFHASSSEHPVGGGHQRQQPQHQQKQHQVLLGTCPIGPSGTVTRANSHWRQMIKKMGVPIAMWHDLIMVGGSAAGVHQQQHQMPGPSSGCCTPRLMMRCSDQHHDQHRGRSATSPVIGSGGRRHHGGTGDAGNDTDSAVAGGTEDEPQHRQQPQQQPQRSSSSLLREVKEVVEVHLATVEQQHRQQLQQHC